MELYFENMTPKEGTKEKLLRDLSALVQDAEELVAATGTYAAQESKQAMEAALIRLRSKAARLRERAVTGGRYTDRVIQKYPYHSIGLAVAAGLLIGVMVGRR